MNFRNILACLFVTVIILISSNSAFSYGYGELGDDPLIEMFKKIVTEAKKPDKDWGVIAGIINDAKKPIETLDIFFGTKLTAKFDQAIKDQDLSGLIKYSANLVFLSMMEKYELILRDNFSDYTFAKGRLGICDKYYKEIFKGNVMKYDEKNGTNLNGTIMTNLQDIGNTIGKPAKFGVGQVPPQSDQYKEMYRNIKSNILIAFPYFEG